MKTLHIKTKYYTLGLLLVFSLGACKEEGGFPRPFAFPRIDFPQKTSYTSFNEATCPFTFEYPDFGVISRSKPGECWVDIDFKDYDCKWHISYRNAKEGDLDRDALFEEHRTLIYKHIKKATEITPSEIKSPNGYGIIHEVYGNVGTPLYVFLSDYQDEKMIMSTFYFQTALKNDSLAPVISYMKEEMLHMTETLQWK